MVGLECMTVIDILHTRLNDMAFRLAHVHILYNRVKGLCCLVSLCKERVGVGGLNPFYIVIHALMERVDDGHQPARHGRIVTGVDRQHVVAAVKVGR